MLIKLKNKLINLKIKKGLFNSERSAEELKPICKISQRNLEKIYNITTNNNK